jgi:CelD/BcsL family acetyltransferase involved in cellulose biosynthesis
MAIVIWTAPWYGPTTSVVTKGCAMNAPGVVRPGVGACAAARGSDIVATLIRGPDAIQFVQSWRQRVAPTEFVTPEWITAAWRYLPDLGDAVVAVARDDAGWCAVALAGRPAERPEFSMAGSPLGDEHDAVASTPADGRRLVPHLVDFLERLAAGGAHVVLAALAAHGVLSDELATRPDRWRIDTEPAPVYLAGSARATDAGHRRRLKALGRLGEVRLDMVEDARLTGAEVEEFVRRRLAGWALRGRLGELPDVERLPGFPRFMAAAVGGLAQCAQARLHVLDVGGRRAAETLYLGPRSDPLMYMTSYDSRLGQYSPGRVLMEDTLLGLGSEVRRVRSGRGDEPYKFDAGAQAGHVVTAVLGATVL